jgi:hypothetical protein
MKSTTLYEEHGFGEIITGLVRVYQPRTIIDLGTQQGVSAILLARYLKSPGLVYTYDLFQTHYNEPPYAKTHACFDTAVQNIKEKGMDDRIVVVKEDAYDAQIHHHDVDLLHVDLCNHYGNVHKVLKRWYKKVNKIILLEGGGHNDWQKKYGFQPFYGILEEPWIISRYNSIVFKKDDHRALTVMIRRESR